MQERPVTSHWESLQPKSVSVASVLLNQCPCTRACRMELLQLQKLALTLTRNSPFIEYFRYGAQTRRSNWTLNIFFFWSGSASRAGWADPLPPVNRMTHRCKNITLPETLFAGSNNVIPEKARNWGCGKRFGHDLLEFLKLVMIHYQLKVGCVFLRQLRCKCTSSCV